MNKPVSVAVATLLSATLGAGAVSSPVLALTLDEALTASYGTNPQLEAQRALLRAIDEQVPQAMAGWRPTVTVNGSVGRENLDYRGNSPGAGGYVLWSSPYTGSITASQTLYNGGITANSVNAADNTIKAGRSTLLSVEQQVFLQAATSYVNIIKDQAVVELSRNNQTVLERLLASVQDQFRVGQLTRTDVSQAQASVAGAVASISAARGVLETDLANFQKVVGLSAISLVDPGMVKGLPSSLEEAISLAVANQPDVLAAAASADASKDSVKVAEGGLLPTVSLSASYTDNNHVTTSQSIARTALIQATVSVPLYEAGATWSKIRASKQTAGQSRILVEQARQLAKATVVQYWQSLVAARAQMVSYQSQVEASQVALEGVRREQQVGSRTILDVLTAEQTLLNAKVSLAGAVRDDRVASYQVLAGVGRLNAASLGLPVKLYNPDAHAAEVRNAFFGGNTTAGADGSK